MWFDIVLRACKLGLPVVSNTLDPTLQTTYKLKGNIINFVLAWETCRLLFVLQWSHSVTLLWRAWFKWWNYCTWPTLDMQTTTWNSSQFEAMHGDHWHQFVFELLEVVKLTEHLKMLMYTITSSFIACVCCKSYSKLFHSVASLTQWLCNAMSPNCETVIDICQVPTAMTITSVCLLSCLKLRRVCTHLKMLLKTITS